MDGATSAMVLVRPSTAPLKTIAPVAMKTSSSTSQPLRYACGPINIVVSQ
jgi:hypothetical protein